MLHGALLVLDIGESRLNLAPVAIQCLQLALLPRALRT